MLKKRNQQASYSQQQTLSRFLSQDQVLPAQLSLLNWNINKNKQANSQQDLTHFCHQKDLVFLQEVALEDKLYNCFEEDFHLSFSQGFSTAKHNTGVLTLAKAHPLSCHRFSIREPLLRTPKASLLTEYYIGADKDILLCINLHAVNFSIGTRIFKQQLQHLHQFIARHQGPVLISGDFNTWRAARHYAVDDMMHQLNMQALDYGSDERKSAFGRALDHIFVRGLHLDSIEIHNVSSSDHNPIEAKVSLM